MQDRKLGASPTVFIPAMDDEHAEVFQALTTLNGAFSNQPPAEIAELARALDTRVRDHFANEERVMRASRYGSLKWHKKNHDSARKRVSDFVQRIGQGDEDAGPALVEYLTSWLRDHTGIADMMFGAFLRNRTRGL